MKGVLLFRGLAMALPTTPNAAAGNLLQALEDLDKGILNHTHWLKGLHRSLVCDDESPREEDLYNDAHCRCNFGQWYYYGEHRELDDLPAFAAIGKLHRSMHDSAREVLQHKLADAPIRSDKYDSFIDQSIAFKSEVRRLQHEIIQQVCVVDPLTGAWNRHSMSMQLTREHERVHRNNSSCILSMLDIDHFKQINDHYGHTVGDMVLREVIERCSNVLRSYDSIFRFGGEEFLICMPDIDPETASSSVERIRKTIEAEPFVLESGESIPVTASFGVAHLHSGKSLEDTIVEADHALLAAKSSGRNRIRHWDS